MTRLLIIIFFLFSCGGKKSPSPEPEEFILDTVKEKTDGKEYIFSVLSSDQQVI